MAGPGHGRGWARGQVPLTNPLCSGGRLPRVSCTQFVIFTQQGLGPDIISCVITLIYSHTSLLLQQCPPHHQFKNLQYLILRVDVFAKYPHHQQQQQQQQSNFVANPMVSGYCGKHLASLRHGGSAPHLQTRKQ